MWRQNCTMNTSNKFFNKNDDYSSIFISIYPLLKSINLSSFFIAILWSIIITQNSSMAEQVSEYQQFRLQRIKGGFDDDNNSAHFSLKDSNLNFTQRMQINSSRSSPYQIGQSLEKELFAQKKMYNDLEQKHTALMQKYKELELKYEENKLQLVDREAQNNKLRETLMMRKELERETKKKLKDWVAEAKKGLNQ